MALSEGQILLDSQQFNLAKEKIELAYNFYKVKSDLYLGDLAEAANHMGIVSMKIEKYRQSEMYFNEAIQIWDKLYPEGTLKVAKASQNVSSCYWFLTKFDSALIFCKKAFTIRKELLPPRHCDFAQDLHLFGRIYLQLGEYLLAQQKCDSALSIATNCYGAESPNVARILETLGAAYQHLGNIQKSIAIQEQSLVLKRKVYPPFHQSFINTYSSLGRDYKILKQFKQSLYYFEKALEIQLHNFGDSTMQTAGLFSEIGQIFLFQNDYNKALEYFVKNNNLLIKLDATKITSYAYVCSDLGRAYSALADYSKAIEWFQKAVTVWRNCFKNVNSQLASFLIRLGNVKRNQGDYEGAVFNYLEAGSIWETLYKADQKNLSIAFRALALTYRQWYLQNKQDSLLQKSRYYFQLAEVGIEQRLLNEQSSVMQKNLLSELLQEFEKAISTELQLFELWAYDSTALENAWHNSEAMHSYLLVVATQESKALHFAGIPDTLLRHDSLLSVQLAALSDKRVSYLKTQGLSLIDSLVISQNAKIYGKIEEQTRLHKFFETNFPSYSHLKHKVKLSSIRETQNLLSNQQSLLEYFTGDSSIFIFIVQSKKSKVIELKLDFPLRDWVNELHEGITSYYSTTLKTPAQYEKTVKQYVDASCKLYGKLIAPVSEWLTSDLIIVPDGILANLSFEALLTAVPKDLSNFGTYPFLLNNHNVQYAYSATMLHEMMAKQHSVIPNSDLLAFAPFYTHDSIQHSENMLKDLQVRYGLSALPYTGEEVQRIQKQVHGPFQILIGNSATKQKFQEMASQFRIIHLATHGKANHLEGEYSYLAFSTPEDSIEQGFLSVGELYNLKLNADLVVLSACETAIGEEQRGEGVISLSRAFAYAGAKSIIATLWKVNDKSTMEIMENFYKELAMHHSKNMAIRNAKLKYMEKNPGQASHPFFWAGFIPIGDMSALK